jgi:hypothetical protein
MRMRLLGIVLSMAFGQAGAQPAELLDARVAVLDTIADPGRAVEQAEGGWLAFSMPAIAGTRSPCCWAGRRPGFTEVGCSLERELYSYGTHSESPLTDSLFVYGRIEAGRVRELRVVGEQCPVDANGADLTWIGRPGNVATLDWLEGVARSGASRRTGHGALFALALHGDHDATRRLYRFAGSANADLSHEAIFWLGEARGDEGFSALERLLQELPHGETRREINFALSQMGTAQATSALERIARTDADPGQRSTALFWMAEEYPARAQGLLREVLDSEQDPEQAVFAVSQLPGEAAGRMLLELARDAQKPREVRRQALFWLADSEDDEAVAALIRLLTRQ